MNISELIEELREYPSYFTVLIENPVSDDDDIAAISSIEKIATGSIKYGTSGGLWSGEPCLILMLSGGVE